MPARTAWMHVSTRSCVDGTDHVSMAMADDRMDGVRRASAHSQKWVMLGWMMPFDCKFKICRLQGQGQRNACCTCQCSSCDSREVESRDALPNVFNS
eukprot:1978097-Pleurochrysis_carterae.AAC.3